LQKFFGGEVLQFLLKRKKISLKSVILSLYFISILLFGAILVWQLFNFVNYILYECVNVKTKALTQAIQMTIHNQDVLNRQTIELLELGSNDKKRAYVKVLKNNLNLYSVYSANKKGDVFSVVNMDMYPDLRNRYKAKPEDKWLIFEMDGSNKKREKVSFLDANLNSRDTIYVSTDYDPRKRPWYEAAMETDKIITTLPYKFKNIPTKGISYAKRIDDNQVVGIDVIINNFTALYSMFLENVNTHAYLFTDKKEILSARYKNGPLRKFFEKELAFKNFSTPQRVFVDKVEYIVQIKPIQAQEKEYVALFAPYKEVQKPYKKRVYAVVILFLLGAGLITPLIISLSNSIVSPLFKLMMQVQKLEYKNFEQIKSIDSSILEISQLSNSILTAAKGLKISEDKLKSKIKYLLNQLKSNDKSLFKMATTDKLTKVYNRIKLEDVLDEQVAITERYGSSFSLIFINLDPIITEQKNRQKVVNEILAQTAKALKANIRKADVIGRWEDETFLIISPHILEDQAFKIAQKIGTQISNYHFKSYEKKVTVSIALHEFVKNENLKEILREIKDRLDKAKDSGGDRIEII
jgi:diguanylate cyclase (GGDEF)-like protein